MTAELSPTPSRGFSTGLQAADVEPGSVVTVTVQGVPLCVGRTLDGRLGAIDDVCTHDEGDLGDGELEGTAVECPRHGGRFDLFTGRVLALPPVIPVRAYPAYVENDVVMVDLP
ncbi:MAG TPA: non-heme iron oxygenase ferredoxin subunit [Candidatus Limnocylindria bacterium]|jgi:3-phenylpropionate/trans-cinnamate dioxygenase ferredoxin subunit